MEYISAEEFLKQHVEVQQVFLDWWKPEMYDLSFKNYGNNKNNFLNGIYKGCIQDNETLRTVSNKELMYYPLFTEGQLRQFIQDKTGGKLRVIELDGANYNIVGEHKTFVNIDSDLLQAYWKVALEIAEEGTNRG